MSYIYRTVAMLMASISLQALQTAQAQLAVDERGLVFESGNVTVQAKGAVAVQTSWYEPLAGGTAREGSEFDGSAVIFAEWETSSGLLFGARGEVDTGNQDIQDFERDELYVYVSSDLGRVELGENDGPADGLAFHAPTIGLGQVRGDFGRYTGSVALLSPYDSRDALKVSYYSPPVGGFRAGVSYSPEFESRADAPDPRDRILQSDVYEFGAQYVAPIGNWVAGLSGAYVKGTSNPITEREDISSWSVGTELRRGKLTLGTAYVDRGKSDLRATADGEDEWNAGASWDQGRWEAAASYAVTRDGPDREHRAGAGLDFDLTKHVYLRVDAVRLVSEFEARPKRDGWVGIAELGFRF